MGRHTFYWALRGHLQLEHATVQARQWPEAQAGCCRAVSVARQIAPRASITTAYEVPQQHHFHGGHLLVSRLTTISQSLLGILKPTRAPDTLPSGQPAQIMLTADSRQLALRGPIAQLSWRAPPPKGSKPPSGSLAHGDRTIPLEKTIGHTIRLQSLSEVAALRAEGQLLHQSRQCLQGMSQPLGGDHFHIHPEQGPRQPHSSPVTDSP